MRRRSTSGAGRVFVIRITSYNVCYTKLLRPLRLIRASGIGSDAPIIDIGGGASTLVDHLLDAGFEDLTVLDISERAFVQSFHANVAVFRGSRPASLAHIDMQPVFSFKLRGAYNKIAKLSPERLKRGVICASAGNHAQGVALSAAKIGCRAVIVMPIV